MDLDSRDAYEQFSDASTTPVWDFLVGLVALTTILGGGLAGIFAAGYFSVGRASLAWPLLGTLAVLLAVDVALLAGRRAARRRG